MAAGDNLTVNWGAGYIDAKFQEFIDAFGTDISDEATIQNTPEWTFNAGINYARPLQVFGRGLRHGTRVRRPLA